MGFKTKKITQLTYAKLHGSFITGFVYGNVENISVFNQNNI